MAKRRRRIKIKNSSLFAFIILNLLFASSVNSHHVNSHHQHHPDYRASSQQIMSTGGNSGGGDTSTAHLCALLPSHISRHLKLCKLISNSPNADEAVALGASKGLAECRNQFKTERWNCTHAHGDHHLLTSELAQSVGNRESGFVHAIAAAGIVHSIATACSVGNLSDCACDKSRIGSYWHMDEKWKWGGCSNNIRHGMLFAKHLVELLDAVHQHQVTSQLHSHHSSHNHHQQHQHHQHRLKRRSLSSRHREPNQLRGRSGAASGTAEQASVLATSADLSFCQRNHNISQAAHMKLIKSLLSSNSLEKHQEFRLAMNMHNNKVGRMAVARNMEFRCRCHGLSGSCSLKTCWLTLPNFQVIGAYLKKKYEASVHLPTAVDVNKLIPMMNRDEISAILSNQAEDQQQQQQPPALLESSSTTAASTGDHSARLSESQDAGYISDLQADQPVTPHQPISAHFILPPTTKPLQPQQNLTEPINVPAHYNYYERHRQQLQQSNDMLNGRIRQQEQIGGSNITNQTVAATSENELPVNIAPLSQQQYQALLRDMRLCNTTTTTNGAISYLTTRDLQQQQLESQQSQLMANNQKAGRQIFKKSNNNNNQQQQQLTSGSSMKNANQHLSHILQHSTNKDELIYLHKSPNYCDADLKHGFLGIQSRVCSDNPSAPNNCDKLCCGRGFSTRIYQHVYKCDCKFQYCCSIHCSACERETKLLVCN